MLERTAQETTYYVRDLDAAVAFYTEKLGLALIEKFEFGFALIDADGKGSTIGLMSVDTYEREFPAEKGRPEPRLVFQVADLDAQVDAFRAAGVKVSDPGGKKGETRAAHFWDLDDNPFFMWEDGTGTIASKG